MEGSQSLLGKFSSPNSARGAPPSIPPHKGAGGDSCAASVPASPTLVGRIKGGNHTLYASRSDCESLQRNLCNHKHLQAKTREINRIVPLPPPSGPCAPVRLRMLGMLRIDGPATAAARQTAASIPAPPATTCGSLTPSLKKPPTGNFAPRPLVAGAPGRRLRTGRHRERFDSSIAFAQAALTEQVNVMQRAGRFVGLPPDWQATTQINDFTMAVTVERASALGTSCSSCSGGRYAKRPRGPARSAARRGALP